MIKIIRFLPRVVENGDQGAGIPPPTQLTNYPVDLNQKLLDRAVRQWARPVYGGRIGSDTGQRYIGRIGDVDAENVDQFGDRLPKCLPCPSHQPKIHTMRNQPAAQTLWIAVAIRKGEEKGVGTRRGKRGATRHGRISLQFSV